MSDKKVLTKLYLISPPNINVNEFIFSLDDVLNTGLVSCFQLRLKNVKDEDIIESSKALKPICNKYHVPFILNDRLDLVNKVEADGVHLGEGDGSILEARKLLGPKAIIGASCYNSKHLAMEAAEEGADYVAFGAFFDTITKDPKTKADMNIIKDWTLISNIPCVAIGGINSSNCKELVDAGADFIAVVGSIWNKNDDPKSAVNKFKSIIM
ncbi:MAG TPA: thiamine phosphate synthase [Alphaproteobacteria bacterium]|jgi:thiamine-phosphate pyrophosphorylase|nr:thiamine phosphate synthase [Alphaproteobacteria bacterium]HIK87937.1 thiamine phosphate synthase [Alphaproteobacteria bacterium]